MKTAEPEPTGPLMWSGRSCQDAIMKTRHVARATGGEATGKASRLVSYNRELSRRSRVFMTVLDVWSCVCTVIDGP